MKLPTVRGRWPVPESAAARVRKVLLLARAAQSRHPIQARLRAWPPLAPAALGLFSILLTLLTLRFASVDATWSSAFRFLTEPGLFLANWLPLALCLFALYYALGRPWLAFALTAVPALALSLVNYYKLRLRGDPLLFADLSLVGEASAMSRRYQMAPTVGMAAAAMLVLLAAVLLRRGLRGVGRPSPRKRVVGCAVCAAALWGCLQVLVTSDTLYAATGLSCAWLPTQSYIEHGVLYPFVHSAGDLRQTPPEGYDEAEAGATLAALGEDDIPADRRVSVIGVMLEAFNDFTTFDALRFTADPYADLRALQAESYTGQLVVNGFAGETVNTERAFLTGYLDPSDNFRAPVDSFVWYFRRQGYACIGAHPGYNWFYNRLNVNEYLGFESYRFYEDRYYRYAQAGALTPDRLFFPTILSDYRAAAAGGQPVFSFNVSYQNHGPYPTDRRYATAYLAWRDGYEEADYNALNNYLTGVAETCRQLRDLADSLRTEERPVILAVFGDHNPWWGDDASGYRMAGINLDRDTAEGFYQYYCTPYLLWANDAARAVLGDVFQGDGGRVGPSFLMERLFTLAGWGGPPYLKALRALEAHTTFANRQCCLDQGVLTESSGSDAPEWLNAFRRLEYFEKHTAAADAD